MSGALDAYYARGPAIGAPEGDFSTSVKFPEFQKAIRALVAATPAEWRVVELGAGTGELARACAGLREYVTVDASPALRARQLEAGAGRAVASMADLAPAPSLVLANEFLDALPVRRVVGGADGELLEVCVDVKEAGSRKGEAGAGSGSEGKQDRAFLPYGIPAPASSFPLPSSSFRERLLPLRDERVRERLAREGVRPARGQVFDVAPALEEAVRAAARLADPGWLVLVDYGDRAPDLYAPTRLNGTLAVYKAHGKWHDPYEEIGERDITADVDFTAVEHATREAGMEPLGLVSQQRFLEALGADPDDVVVRAQGLGSAFWVFAATRGTSHRPAGFDG